MKYCDIHGMVDTNEATTCPVKFGGFAGDRLCGTVLTAEPNAKWKLFIAERVRLLAESEDSESRHVDESQQSNARAKPRKRQMAFLLAYERCARICEAAEIAGINRAAHYKWLKTEPAYAAAFEDSEVLAAQNLMDEAVKRAMLGSDRLLERLLEAHYPEKFRSNLAHRLIDKKGQDRQLFDVAELDKLIRAADERDKEGT